MNAHRTAARMRAASGALPEFNGADFGEEGGFDDGGGDSGEDGGLGEDGEEEYDEEEDELEEEEEEEDMPRKLSSGILTYITFPSFYRMNDSISIN